MGECHKPIRVYVKSIQGVGAYFQLVEEEDLGTSLWS
jgi:hypothetical protein